MKTFWQLMALHLLLVLECGGTFFACENESLSMALAHVVYQWPIVLVILMAKEAEHNGQDIYEIWF